jgi:hypothetical protein
MKIVTFCPVTFCPIFFYNIWGCDFLSCDFLSDFLSVTFCPTFYFPYHCISLIYFSFTKIRMFLYARIYWLTEFGDVSCLQFNYLQFNYLRVETLTPTWEDLVGHLSDNFKSEVRQNSVSDLRVWSLIHLEGSV